MIILVIKTKEFTGIGPANGYPSKNIAYIFDSEDDMNKFTKENNIYSNDVKDAFVIGRYGEEGNIKDMRKNENL